MRGWSVLLAVALGAFGSSSAFAYAGGVAGYSGQSGPTCSSCHQGGGVPVVLLSGPLSVNSGAQAQYTFTMMGGAASTGGLDVAVTGDATLMAGTDTKVVGGDVIQTTPKAFASGSVSWTFTLQAGSSTGTILIDAAGNSCNGNGVVSGDDSAKTSYTVQITPAPPDAGSGPPDAGTPGQDAGVLRVDGGEVAAYPTQSPNVVEEKALGRVNEASYGSGCTAAGGTPWALSLLFALWALSRRRARLILYRQNRVQADIQSAWKRLTR